jgi:hypothetical protein
MRACPVDGAYSSTVTAGAGVLKTKQPPDSTHSTNYMIPDSQQLPWAPTAFAPPYPGWRWLRRHKIALAPKFLRPLEEKVGFPQKINFFHS